MRVSDKILDNVIFHMPINEVDIVGLEIKALQNDLILATEISAPYYLTLST